MSRLPGLVLLALGACLLFVAPASGQGAPTFSQLAGTDGCLSALGWPGTGDPPCPTAGGLGDPRALALSPDGRQLIVASGDANANYRQYLGSNALAVLNRSASNGALSFASCVSDDGGDGRLGSDGACADGDGLWGANAVAFTPDGRWVFAAAPRSNALTWFARDPDTGKLEQRGCLKNFAWSEERCATEPLLGQANGVAVSPDGTLVFVVAAASSSLTVFRLDPSSGALTRLSCISDTGSDGVCANGSGMRGANHVVATADGGALVLAHYIGAVTSFAVDSSGVVKQRGCLASGGASPGQCESTPSLSQARSMAVSPDGRDLYVGSDSEHSGDAQTLTALRVDPSGALSANGCFERQAPQPGDDATEETPEDQSDEGDEARASANGCTPTRALTPEELAVSSDGRTLFSAGGNDLGMFRRDPATGRLEWLACMQDALTYKTCAQTHANVYGATALTASPDGGNLYLASSSYNDLSVINVFAAALGVARSARVTSSGRALLRVSCPATRPVACAGTLRQPRALRRPARYRLARGAQRSIALRLRPRATRHSPADVTITVTDSTGLTRAMSHHIKVRSP